MNTPVPPAPETQALPEPPVAAPATVRASLFWGVAGLAAVAMVSSAMLWQKIASIQESLAKQSANTMAQAANASAQANQSQDQAREAAARVAVFEARLSEIALQRTQLEELMQSLSRSRDENLVVDIDAAIRLAQQQAQLTGSVEPLLAALRAADQRVTRAAQPRLLQVQRAIARDVDRIKSASYADTPSLLIKLDELVRLADQLPVANDVANANVMRTGSAVLAPAPATWWQRSLQAVLEEARGLVRVSRVERPEATMLSPEQAFFVRENFKLKLLNARLGLLSRQLESARADMNAATTALYTYFDPAAKPTQTVSALLQQVSGQMKILQLPRVDDTLSALTTAAAGK